MSIGDLITYVCLAIALWYVPRYILRVYAPGLYARIKLSIENAVRELQERDYARYQAKQASRYAMSSSGAEDDWAGAGIGADIVVPGQQHQVALELVPSFEAIKSYLTDHTLTDDEAVVLLALVRRADGNDLLSANKIREIVGGNESRVKSQVAAHRRPRTRTKSSPRIERPINGWH